MDVCLFFFVMFIQSKHSFSWSGPSWNWPVTDKGKMQSFEWLQAFKTCSLDQMRARVALLCTESLSKVNPFNSHKQICTPQPIVGECLGKFRAPVFRDTLIIRRLDAEYIVSNYCKQWLYSSVTVMKPRPCRPGKQMKPS